MMDSDRVMKPTELSPATEETLRSAVRRLEDRTAAELVVVVSDRSSEYLAPLVAPGFLSVGVFTALMLVPQTFSVAFIVWAALLGFTLPLLILVTFSRLRCSLTPRRAVTAAVEARAHEAFSRHHVSDTRDREGILLYFSRQERRAVILCDSGIRRVLAENDLEVLPGECVERASRRPFPEGVLDAIDHLGRELGRVSPPSEHRVNELPDGPVTSGDGPGAAS